MADKRNEQPQEQQMTFKDALSFTLTTMGLEQLKPKQVILSYSQPLTNDAKARITPKDGQWQAFLRVL